ncbi:hypothetical protein I0E98_21970 [Pseudomonas lalucatii]|nr:hypothetical protein [Pseudomonas lalucatii]
MDVKHEWYEELPEQCPPSDAFSLDGFVCYRLCECLEPTEGDFLSHRALFPQKTFHAPECRARAISVFKKPEDLDSLLKLAIHKHKAKVRITLGRNDGVAMKTGRDSHYSWWRSRGFNLMRAIEGKA